MRNKNFFRSVAAIAATVSSVAFFISKPSPETIFSVKAAYAQTKEQKQEIRKLVKQLKNKDPKKVSEASSDLVEMGRDAVPVLIDILLKTKNTQIRRDMVLILGNIRDPSAVPSLIEVSKDQDAWVQKRCVWALGYIGKASVPYLIDAMNNKDQNVRKTVIQALQNIGTDAVSSLIGALGNKDKHIRADAAWLLGEIGDVRALPYLATISTNDEFQKPRQEAKKAIEKIKEKQKRK